MSTVGEFDLLRDARQDVRRFAWAHPPRREAVRLYFNVKRAREEIVRCNLESQRLLTWMFDEHIDFYRAIAANMISNPLLAWELSARWEERNRINTVLARRLSQLCHLPGFTGTLMVGQREGRKPLLHVGISYPCWAFAISTSTEGGTSKDEADDCIILPTEGEQEEEFVEYLDRLVL